MHIHQMMCQTLNRELGEEYARLNSNAVMRPVDLRKANAGGVFDDIPSLDAVASKLISDSLYRSLDPGISRALFFGNMLAKKNPRFFQKFGGGGGVNQEGFGSNFRRAARLGHIQERHELIARLAIHFFQ